MDNIKQWALTLCIICVASGVLHFLLPDGTVKKSAEITFSVLLLISVLSILKNDIFSQIDINYSQEIISPYSNSLNAYVKGMADDEVIKIIRNSLDTVCSADYHVAASWEIDNNTYRLLQITVTVSREDESSIDKIKSEVGSLTGVIPEVKISDEY